MPFRPKPVQPEFNDLITSLSNSRNQIKDNALYQTIFLLIKRLTISKDLTQKQIKDIDETLDNILSATFLTVDDESNLLVNSRKEVAGPGITFNDATPHIRVISASGGGGTTFGGNTSPIPFPEEPEIVYFNEILGNYPPSGSGSVGPQGPQGIQGIAGPPGLDGVGDSDSDAPIGFIGNIINSTLYTKDGYWAPLTDGNVDETDLIFASGEAVMVFVPV